MTLEFKRSREALLALAVMLGACTESSVTVTPTPTHG